MLGQIMQQLMRTAGFPYPERQQRRHAKFMALLQTFKQRYDDDDLALAAQLPTVPRHCLFLHIWYSDKELLVHLNNRSAR